MPKEANIPRMRSTPGGYVTPLKWSDIPLYVGFFMAFDFVTFSTDPSRPLHAYRQTSLAGIRSAAGDEEAFWMYL